MKTFYFFPKFILADLSNFLNSGTWSIWVQPLKLNKTISVQPFQLFMSHIWHVQDLESLKWSCCQLGKLATFAWYKRILENPNCLGWSWWGGKLIQHNWNEKQLDIAKLLPATTYDTYHVRHVTQNECQWSCYDTYQVRHVT